MIPPLGMAMAIDYPATRKAEVVDVIHGTKVPDPYRWLEDDNAAETKAWVAAQNEVTEAYLDKLPQRAAIRDRLAALWNFERGGVPQEFGGKWFFTHNSGLQNQSVLKVAEVGASAPASQHGWRPVGGGIFEGREERGGGF